MRRHVIHLSVIRRCHPPARWVRPPATVRERRSVRRIYIFILVLLCGTALVASGSTPQTVTFTLFGLGLAAATIATCVVDGTALPSPASVLPPSVVDGGIA